jgi:NADH dehydrogenase
VRIPWLKNKKTAKTRVVIVGSGFAGLSAARELEAREDVEITLVDRTNHHLFQPLLYQVATGGLNPSEIASPVRSLFRNAPRTSVVLGSLEKIDLEQRAVELEGDKTRLSYDYLVLALGGKSSYFGHPEWETHAPGLKSLEDARVIRERVLLAFERAEREPDPEARRRLMTIVVIGGGPTGVEMAGALAELRSHVLAREFKNIQPEQARILLLEAGPRLLPTFPAKLSEKARRELHGMGVSVMLDETVEHIEAEIVRTRRRTIEARTIIWAAGVSGHPLACQLGAALDRGGRVIITSSLNVPGQPNVFCLGDMSNLASSKGDPLPGVAQVAIQQGRHAARNIIRSIEKRKMLPFRYFDKGSMATIGRKSAVAVLPGGLTLTGGAAWLGWLAIHVAFIVDVQNRILVVMRWAWAYLGWKWNVRLIGEGPTEDGPSGSAALESEFEPDSEQTPEAIENRSDPRLAELKG